MSGKQVKQLDRVVIRFAGDSGDGMQLTGARFTSDTALLGNDLSTLPNFPASMGAAGGPGTGAAGHDPTALPRDLPRPQDDGAADHLPGAPVPHVVLVDTDGQRVDLAGLPGRSVVYAYPRTGRPGQPPLADDWDLIPGARGCTP